MTLDRNKKVLEELENNWGLSKSKAKILLDAIYRGDNILITGSVFSGKSKLIYRLADMLDLHDVIQCGLPRIGTYDIIKKLNKRIYKGYMVAVHGEDLIDALENIAEIIEDDPEVCIEGTGTELREQIKDSFDTVVLVERDKYGRHIVSQVAPIDKNIEKRSYKIA